MRNTLIILLLLTASCTVYPPGSVYSYGDDVGERIYTEMGVIDVDRVHSTFVLWNEINGGLAGVSDGKTIGVRPLIIDVTKGGIPVIFHSELSLIRYFEAHGWVFDGYILVSYNNYVGSELIFIR